MAVAFPASGFKSATFQNNLTAFLEQASLERIDKFAAKTRKAGVDLAEARDTADPAMITRFLMTLLDTKGKKINPRVLKKRVRDDVYWDNAELPWRRSSFWLALRVCVQRLFLLRLGAQNGRFLYKTLMCALMAQLLEDCLGNLSPESCNFLKTKLCRRLAKLEAEKQRCSTTFYNSFSTSVTAVETRCRELVSLAKNSFETNWRAFKAGIQTKIPPLPLSAQDGDLQFSLPNSASYLQQVLSECPVQSIHAIDQERCGSERGESAA
ncbi:unnamed protein product [Penicillium salamii]|uniref:DUF6606 domain-containing protein n=1 Tax=Penicillium salamii TaxID=1612424 RepID=A0A9W4N4T9_9EURO|nr:unnamed protein product [Penicillium salamii]CAG7985943.1 unnamed protein product [Penicillium salamii]CAG8217892.1 unnamed protein product [Penicillium salamii]CAG8253932.1 unnamed protein product [Penicillium salamii]CAG8256808.1 unnamed protein product [Penicillium salamii]